MSNVRENTKQKKLPVKNKTDAEENDKASRKEEKLSFLDKAQENLESSAEVVKEKYSEIADKTVDSAGEVYETVKKGLSTAYDTGSKVVDDLTKTAQEYIDRFNNNMEIRKLNEQRDELMAQLGKATFVNYKVSKKIPQKLAAEKNIVELIVKIENIDKEIINVGKKLGK